MKLYPSLMCVDFARLHTEIPALHNTGVAGYHIDIMDGNFVPNFALGSNDIKAVASLSDKELDVHLMVNNADQAIHSFLDLPVQRICFHHEACVHHHRVVSLIRQKGMKAGIAVNPGTSVSAIADILPELDFVLVMSVNPGFAGRSTWISPPIKCGSWCVSAGNGACVSRSRWMAPPHPTRSSCSPASAWTASCWAPPLSLARAAPMETSYPSCWRWKSKEAAP